MPEPFVQGLGTYDESGARQIHTLPSVHRLIPLLAVPPDDDLHLCRGLCVDMADPDAD